MQKNLKEEEVTEIDIEDGCLSGDNNESVDLTDLTPHMVEEKKNISTVYIFVLIGGLDVAGLSLNIIDILGNSALSVPPLPSALTQNSLCTSAYTDRSITACSRGVRSLTPYGYYYAPGSCYAYDFQDHKWGARGGRMMRYRRGASVTKLGRLGWKSFYFTKIYLQVFASIRRIQEEEIS